MTISAFVLVFTIGFVAGIVSLVVLADFYANRPVRRRRGRGHEYR